MEGAVHRAMSMDDNGPEMSRREEKEARNDLSPLEILVDLEIKKRIFSCMVPT